MAKAQKQAQQLENHKLLIQRLELEKSINGFLTKRQLKRLARQYAHSLKSTKTTAKRVMISVR